METKQEKFNRLYKSYRDMVKGAFNKYSSIESKDDMIQDYWLYIWNNLDYINDQWEASQMKYYIPTIVDIHIKRNNAIKRKGYTTSIDEQLHEELTLLDLIENTDNLNTVKITDYTNRQEIIESLLETLKIPKKGNKGQSLTKSNEVAIKDVKILKEYFYNDKTYDVIAEEYNMSKENVRLRIDSTIGKLRKIMQDNNITRDDI
jgi:RNA polymerase sigma factor (sigma-70 family)